MLPKLIVDKGAIKFVFGGANVMSPGMTHKTVKDSNALLKLEVGDPVVRRTSTPSVCFVCPC
jgi:predicted ribosome-associated RNA-binding protein Tma20